MVSKWVTTPIYTPFTSRLQLTHGSEPLIHPLPKEILNNKGPNWMTLRPSAQIQRSPGVSLEVTPLQVSPSWREKVSRSIFGFSVRFFESSSPRCFGLIIKSLYWSLLLYKAPTFIQLLLGFFWDPYMALLQSLLALLESLYWPFLYSQWVSQGWKIVFFKRDWIAFLVMYLLSLTRIIILPTQTMRYHYCEWNPSKRPIHLHCLIPKKKIGNLMTPVQRHVEKRASPGMFLMDVSIGAS